MKKQRVYNPRFPHTIKVTRMVVSDNPFDDEGTPVILYCGKGRSYTNTTTDGDGKVVTNMRKASIPVLFDEWKGDRCILNGDTIEVMIGDIYEKGVVRDMEPCNFGTEISWDYIRT